MAENGAADFFSVDEISMIFDEALSPECQKPYVCLPLRIKNRNASDDDKNNEGVNEPDFILGVMHMTQRVSWKIKHSDHLDCKSEPLKKRAKVANQKMSGTWKMAGPEIMGIHAFAAIRKFRELRNKYGKRVPMVLAGDWNTMPTNDAFDYYLERKIVKHRKDYPCNHLIELLCNKSNSAETGMPKSPQALFSALEHLNDFPLRCAYKVKHGEFPELTTHTQEFIGAIDHMFITHGVRVESMLMMPSREEAREKQLWTPNTENEPSDHLLQRAVFRI